MPSHPEIASKFGFGVYEIDVQAGELWKAGRKIKLQSQPFKVLTLLLEKPGEVVTREDLQLQVWGNNIVVDFDHSLGTAINKIRDALGDSADNPRFIETLAKRGYRFIAPVTVLGGSSATVVAGTPKANPVAESGSPEMGLARPLGTSPGVEAPSVSSMVDLVPLSRRRSGFWLWLAAAGMVAILACSAGFYSGSRRAGPLPRIERLTRSGRIAPGVQVMESLPASATDGLRIFIP
jgi:DNA-binding winged helix-turn-helix (wHTH) protein